MSDDDERIAALNALLQMNAERAMPILKQVLAKRDACSASLREKAVFLVSQKRTPETENVLLDVVSNDPSREVRKKAVFWLGQVNTDRAATALEQPPLVQHARTRSCASRRCSPSCSSTRRPRPGPCAPSPGATQAPASLREKAVFWLGQQQSPENATFLRGLFDELASSNAPDAATSRARRRSSSPCRRCTARGTIGG